MSSKPSNRAAWLDGFKQPLRVAEAPYTEPGPGEIVVKAAHAAVNPGWLTPIYRLCDGLRHGRC